MEPFWEFALARYARPGVATRCIGLQDELRANVVLLLFLCWRAEHGDAPQGAELQRIMTRAATIDRHLVTPLRAARRALAQAARAFDSPALAAALARIKRAELAAEQREADWLAREAALPEAGRAPDRDAAALATISIGAYLAAIGTAAPRARAEAAAIARALLAA